MATVDLVAQFRTRFGATFANVTDYPTPTILAQLDLAELEVTQCVYGRWYTEAVFLLSAHNLYLESDAEARSAGGAGSGFATAAGPVASASVGDVSTSLNVPSIEKGYDGNFEATIYGQKFLRIRRKVSRGPLLANRAVTTMSCYPTGD